MHNLNWKIIFIVNSGVVLILLLPGFFPLAENRWGKMFLNFAPFLLIPTFLSLVIFIVLFIISRFTKKPE